MTRRCSHCSHNGHNSRTCPNRGVKLFGVRLTNGLIRKSASMSNLSQFSGSNSASHNGNGSGSPGEGPDHADGYASEDFVRGSSSSRDRKKGVPWTEEEHRMFLLGLQKLGKGDWRGISRNYVISRTPTQVASHAQKYFIRQSHVSRRKRRSSLFDIVADELFRWSVYAFLHYTRSMDFGQFAWCNSCRRVWFGLLGEGGLIAWLFAWSFGVFQSGDTPMVSQDLYPADPLQAETQSNDQLPIPPPLDEEDEPMDSNNSNDGEPIPPTTLESIQPCYPVLHPAYYPPFIPLPFPYWMGYSTEPTKTNTHEVVKPTAVHLTHPINVDELVGMSKLSLGESIGDNGPSSLSLRLDGSSRQSAFHANPASRGLSGSPIHAV